MSDSRQSILELFYARLGVMRRGADYSTTCCIFHDAPGKRVLICAQTVDAQKDELVGNWLNGGARQV